jgi:hypothetical protein
MQRSGLLTPGLLLFTEILICVSLASLLLENSINCVFCGCRANLLRLKYVLTSNHCFLSYLYADRILKPKSKFKMNLITEVVWGGADLESDIIPNLSAGDRIICTHRLA